MTPEDTNKQEKINQLLQKTALQRQQVDALREFYNQLFPYEGFELSSGQYLIWLGRYDFDIIIAALERCLVWVNKDTQEMEADTYGFMQSEVTKISLVKYASKVMSLKKAEAAVKSKRSR
jgi:hypothetical protein